MSKVRNVMVWLAVAALLFVAPVALAQNVTPSVEVNDQAIVNGTVTVARVVSDGPGWIVIHADNNGSPGTVLGYTAVQDGENTNIVVDIDTTLATNTLYAMLHSDLGIVGTYEFPGADTPVQVNGQTVVKPFTVTGGLEATNPMTGTMGITTTAQVTPTTVVTTTTEVTTTAAVTTTTGATTTTGPQTLPVTGGSTTPWLPLALLALGVAVVVGSALIMRRSQPTHVRKD